MQAFDLDHLYQRLLPGLEQQRLELDKKLDNLKKF